MSSPRTGLIADEPSLVGLCADTGSVTSVGKRAARAAAEGRSRTVEPLRAGVIADVDAAAALLEPILRRARRLGLVKPRVLACAPTDARENERAAIVEALSRAGAGSVRIVPEPLAAAVGCGLDISSPYAQMLVDIGDGVTDVAVVSAGNVVIARAIRTACSDLHRAVQASVSGKHGVAITRIEADRLTRLVGVKTPASDSLLDANGTDEASGKYVRLQVRRTDLATAIRPVVDQIVDTVAGMFAALPALMSIEIIENGVWLTGGGARLDGMAGRLAEATSLEVHVAADPLNSVINGARQMVSVAGRTGLWVG